MVRIRANRIALSRGAPRVAAAGRRRRPAPAAPSTWQIEAVVGIGAVSPDDLNARVAYDTAWLDYLRAAQVTQQHDGAARGIAATPCPFTVASDEAESAATGRWAGDSRTSPAGKPPPRRRPIATRSTDPTAQEYQRTVRRSRSTSTRWSSTFATICRTACWASTWRLAARLRLGGSIAAGWVVRRVRTARSSVAQGGFYATDRRDRPGHDRAGQRPGRRPPVDRPAGAAGRFGCWWRAGSPGTNVSRHHRHARQSTQRIQDGEATEVELEQTAAPRGAGSISRSPFRRPPAPGAARFRRSACRARPSR